VKNYYYLVINEDINSGLLKSQVIEPIKHFSDEKFKLINVHKINNKNEVYKDSVNLPIAIPYRLFLFNFLFFLTPVIAFGYALILTVIIKNNSVVISRSYFPSLVAYILNKLKNIDYVFDTRSLFIDENTLNGSFKHNSINYKMWKYFEKKILKNSYKTTAVALKQKEYYETICPKANIELIPCFISPLKAVTVDRQIRLRLELGFNSEDIVIVYYGSLDDGWNNIDMYAKAFKNLSDQNYKVLIISQNYTLISKDSRLVNENIIILNTTHKTGIELSEYMQLADYGIVLMRKAADWETRLSVKFVEYLNAGLQVIVGEHVGEAVRYANGEFLERTVIYKNNPLPLNRKGVYPRDKVDSNFGIENFKKLIR